MLEIYLLKIALSVGKDIIHTQKNLNNKKESFVQLITERKQNNTFQLIESKKELIIRKTKWARSDM